MPTSHDPSAPVPPASDSIFGLPSTFDDAAIVLIPVPFDATCSYGVGSSRGPAAILEASGQLDLLDHRFGAVHERGIFMQPIPPEIETLSRSTRPLVERIAAKGEAGPEDADAVAAIESACELVNAFVHEQTALVLEAGKVPGVIGGEHSVSLGAIAACAARAEAHDAALGVLQIDAHKDLRRSYMGLRFSHASVMLNAFEHTGMKRLVQIGIRDYAENETGFAYARNVATLFWDDAADAIDSGTPWRDLCRRMIAQLPSHVYVSFDIDGLDPSLCPGTGTPVPGGLSWDQASILIEQLRTSGKTVVGFDIVEVSPTAAAGAGRIDAIVGARMLYRLCGIA